MPNIPLPVVRRIMSVEPESAPPMSEVPTIEEMLKTLEQTLALQLKSLNESARKGNAFDNDQLARLNSIARYLMQAKKKTQLDIEAETSPIEDLVRIRDFLTEKIAERTKR